MAEYLRGTDQQQARGQETAKDIAARGDVPIRGVVNFAGGRGGKPNNQPNVNCAPDRLVDAAGVLGRTATVLRLWL